MKNRNLDKRFIIAVFAAFIFASILLYVLTFGSAQKVADPDVIKSRISHMGEVLDYEVIPSTGLTAWKIKPEGLDRHFIFYTTSNGKALLTGSIWDAESGTEISSGIKLVQDSMVYNQEAGLTNPSGETGSPIDAATASDQNMNDTSFAATDGIGEAIGEYDQEPPIMISFLDKLKGYKTDESVSATDTVYLFFDPRCPVCKKAFNKIELIDLKAKGLAVKWIPTTALTNGSDPKQKAAHKDGVERAAYTFRAKNHADFTSLMNGNARVDASEVTKSEREYLEDNQQILVVTAAEIYGEDYKPEVPAAIYMNKQTGAPKLLFGISNDPVLKTIFGE
ncbi:MAG: hypothetical protein VYA60_04400 [Pseudomonadota bacterium]|nr:hypothetical protein [Pseudomonadota bacterium]